MTKNMECLPFAGGWAEQPYEITTVIALFNCEQNKWEAEELEKSKQKNK